VNSDIHWPLGSDDSSLTPPQLVDSSSDEDAADSSDDSDDSDDQNLDIPQLVSSSDEDASDADDDDDYPALPLPPPTLALKYFSHPLSHFVALFLLAVATYFAFFSLHCIELRCVALYCVASFSLYFVCSLFRLNANHI
jgi:hypothetical protein